APHIFEFWGAASGGPGYFVDLSTVLPSTSSRLSYSLAAADLNLDGLIDLVVGNTGSMKSIFLQGAGGSFTSGADFGTTNQALTIRLGHVNNDNLIDVVIGNYGALNVWYAGTGGGSFGTGQIFGAS